MTKHKEAEQTLKREIIQRTERLDKTTQNQKEELLKQIKEIEESIDLLSKNN